MSTGIPNPDTYLNHFPPAIATQSEVARDLTIAVLAAVVWDILLYIPEDIAILRRGPIHLVTICFVTSRFFAVIFVLLSVIQQTVPLENCNGIIASIGVACLLAMLSSSFLFLQRLRAVYAQNHWVQAIFFTLWLASNGLMTTTIYGAKSAHVPGTGHCVYSHVERYISAAGFMSASFDTAVFLAISYKIATEHSGSDVGVAWDTVISGRALPRLSRSVLQGGQQYYLITVCLTVPVGILIVHPSTPPIYKLMLSFPLVSLTASMACRVFRNVRLQGQTLNHTTSSTCVSNLNFASHSRARKFIMDSGDPEQFVSTGQESTFDSVQMQDMTRAGSSRRPTVQIATPARVPASGPSSTTRCVSSSERSDLVETEQVSNR